MSSPCEPCEAGCCRKYSIPLCAVDIYRLSSKLSLEVHTFAKLEGHKREHGLYRILLSGSPPTERLYYRLVMRKEADPFLGYSERCVFLRTDRQRQDGKCGVYEVRPGVCRTYPYRFDEDVMSVEGGRYCPAGQEGWRAWTNPEIVPVFRLSTQKRDRGFLLHSQLIEEWNQQVLAQPLRRQESDFFSFLLHRTAALVASDESW